MIGVAGWLQGSCFLFLLEMIVLLFFALLWMVDGVFSQLHYTVQEEQEHGTFVGNIAEDLGLDITKLSARRFQTVANSRTPYLDLNLETGVLYVNEKIDREQICKQSPSCVLHLEVFLENPLELFRVEIEVLDINDNPPSFPEPDLTVEISESATPGTRFPLESAFDPDVGTNSLRDYEITPNSYFSLDVQTQGDGNRFAELVLEKPLDREQQAVLARPCSPSECSTPTTMCPLLTNPSTQFPYQRILPLAR